MRTGAEGLRAARRCDHPHPQKKSTEPGGPWPGRESQQPLRRAEQKWPGARPVTIAVRPRVTFTRLRSGRFVCTRRISSHLFAGRLVQLQRWNGVRWVTLRRARLGPRSRAELKATLRKGRSTLRIAFSVDQARRRLPRCDEPVAQVTVERDRRSAVDHPLLGLRVAGALRR